MLSFALMYLYVCSVYRLCSGSLFCHSLAHMRLFLCVCVCLYVFHRCFLQVLDVFLNSILRCVCAGDVENRFVCHIEKHKRLFLFSFDHKKENRRGKNQQMGKVYKRLLSVCWNFFQFSQSHGSLNLFLLYFKLPYESSRA